MTKHVLPTKIYSLNLLTCLIKYKTPLITLLSVVIRKVSPAFKFPDKIEMAFSHQRMIYLTPIVFR